MVRRPEPSYTGLYLLFLFAFQFVLVPVMALDAPVWGDEGHYVNTIEQFGDRLSLELLRTYEEMSGPLPFVLYAAWGNLVGFNLTMLRIFSLLAALVTYILFYRVARTWGLSPERAVIALAILMLNPYMIGLSVFVYTDMLTILFVVFALQGFVTNKVRTMSVALALALLCRQYIVFVSIALIAYQVMQYVLEKDRSALPKIGYLIAAHLPLIALFFLWGGLNPDNDMQQLYARHAFVFHPSFVTTYIAALGAYLLPILVWRWRQVYAKRAVIISAVLCWLYWLFPIEAAEPAKHVGTDTVGLLHGWLVERLGGGIGPDIAFFVLFFVGIPIVIHAVAEMGVIAKRRVIVPQDLWPMLLLAFLIVMPWSYLVWEKYLMPLLPAVILMIIHLDLRKPLKKYLRD